ncbi:hydrolase [Actinomycetospora sp. NBRC 106375]|uniref:alpha/beta fold hydrolase n=1 Tax=Actinomycetospora sp. NBRC 106375 TaxID=3032207 RepID=UPI0024A15450|nr:alpha/beta hydrolase [Actinomycetospora sp. NBRC 106375]GLZ47548.1 hydrolase [Actinomycetospora sp. NBRC 106375]
MAETKVLHADGAEIVYDVHGPLPPADGRPVLLMIGQPMDASGFRALAARFADRTVVAYDPRGLGRSTRSDGRTDNTPQTQAEDLHALIAEIGAGPVEVFGSSGGAVTGLQLVTAHPEDVVTLVAHEPPITGVLPDAEAAHRASRQFREAYQAKGWGHGMAGFMALGSWPGEFTDAYFAQPAPDPGMFGMPTEDDGSRDDPLLSDRSLAVTDYVLDVDRLTSVPTRVVIAVGEETGDTYTARTGRATAAALGREAVVFPSHHGGFLDGEFGWPGKPDEFAATLRAVLDGA